MKFISLTVLTILIVVSISITNDKIKGLKTQEKWIKEILPYMILIVFLMIPIAYIIAN